MGIVTHTAIAGIFSSAIYEFQDYEPEAIVDTNEHAKAIIDSIIWKDLSPTKSVEVSGRILHSTNPIPMFPPVSQSFRRNLMADLAAERGTQRVTKSTLILSDERFETTNSGSLS